MCAPIAVTNALAADRSPCLRADNSDATEKPEAGLTKCGIAVRRDGDPACTAANTTACGGIGNNDMSNWVCNLHTTNEATDCAGNTQEWKRCVSGL